MKTEFGQDDADALQPEHLAAIGGLVEAFMRETGLRFGYTVLVMDKVGIRTMGNMPQDAQTELFTFVAMRLTGEGPTDAEQVSVIMPGTH